MTRIPDSVSYVVVGAGIHGLSTGWHLAMELERRKRGSGRDVVVLDKTGVGAGASGIEGHRVVRPNVYMIADSNHGFKMTGVGKLLARFLMGEHVPELAPFALSRYAEGKTFGGSSSHAPGV